MQPLAEKHARYSRKGRILFLIVNCQLPIVNCSKFPRTFILAAVAAVAAVAVAAAGLFGDAFEGGQRACRLQLAAGREDDLWLLDQGGAELLGCRRPGRAHRQAEVADLAKLDDAPGFEVLVEDVVHAVHDRLDVGRGQRTVFGDLAAKFVESHVAVVHRLRVVLARNLLVVLSEVPAFDQFEFLCHKRISE